jgi:hypothetical protein
MKGKIVSLGNEAPVVAEEDLIFAASDFTPIPPRTVEERRRMDQTAGLGPLAESSGFAADPLLLGASSF